MNFLKDAHIRIGRGFRFSRLLGVVAVLMLGAMAAMAQSVPRNLNFFDGTGSARYNSTGRAFVGHGTGNVDGRIRDGQLRELHVNLDPDVDGPNRLRAFYIYYTPSAGVTPPSLQWYDNGATKRLVISNVPAREYFRGTAVSSNGLAKVEITFVNGAPGKVVVTYQHSAYSSTPPSNITIRYYNGMVFSASPLAGRQLGFQIL